MFKRLHFSFLFLMAFALAATACNATPLPQPPSIESSQLELRPGDNVTILAASAGAVSDGFAGEVRVSAVDGRTTRTVSPDGSFLLSVPGVMVSDIHYIELLSAGEERFILAVQDLGAGTVVAPPGPDADADGSPDAIDCAPMDEGLVGQQCMSACLADDLNCDGLDEDCDGTIDEGCTMCSSDAECLASETCTGGMCMPR